MFKNIKNSPIVLICSMLAFCGWMISFIFLGAKYPNAFFWSFVILFAVIIAVNVVPSKKDAAILVVGVIALSVWGNIVHNFIPEHWNKLLKLIVEFIALAPIYYPLYIHNIKMILKSEK